MDGPRTSRPAAYDLLLGTTNLAADDALVVALPEMEPPYIAQALSVLIARNQEYALAAVVAGIETHPAELRQAVIGQAGALAAGVRHCMKDGQFEGRRAAIALIRESRCAHLAYLLADALTQPCRKTAELAAQALRTLVEALPADSKRFASSHRPMPRCDLDYLMAAVKRGLSSWSSHFRSDTAEAAVRLALHIEDTVISLCDDPRMKVDRAFTNLPRSVCSRETAAHYMRALRCQRLRDHAVRSIVAAATDEARDALLDESWLLADGESRRSFVRVRSLGFLPEGETALPPFGQRGRAAVRTIASAGIGHQRKVALLRRLACGADPVASRAAVWALVENRIEGGDDALQAIAMRGDSPLAVIANVELRRRCGERFGACEQSEPEFSTDPQKDSEESPFDALWAQFDSLPPASRASVVSAVREGSSDFDGKLKQKVTLPGGRDRLRVLEIVAALPSPAGFEELVQTAVRDSDAIVRSLAVRLLRHADDRIARRLLIEALDDPDQRVQANAVEALERVDPDSLKSVFVVKGSLASAGSRVRANAVKAILGTDLRAGMDLLLDMLLSDEPSDRISALWVVERVRLAGTAEVLRGIARGDQDERVRRRALRIMQSADLASDGDGSNSAKSQEALA